MTKTSKGRFFEDYRLGEVIAHAVPRTVSGGERALYQALYPARGALTSSDEFARACGLRAAPVDELIAFHLVFGKSVPDISVNAVANLGYAEGRWLAAGLAGRYAERGKRGHRAEARIPRAGRASSGSGPRGGTSAARRC